MADVSSGGLTNATAIGAGAIVDASNKIRLGHTAVTVIEGQVAFTFSSDATKKENFRPLDEEEVLRKIRELSLTSWNFIGHDPEQFRHYGPMAQDFFAGFGHDEIGTIGTPTTINSGDMAGILMIAAQALERRAAENARLKARIEALEQLAKGRSYPTEPALSVRLFPAAAQGQPEPFGAILKAKTPSTNTKLGAGAFLNNTTGIFNTAIGVFALFNNTTGFFNTAVGAAALSGDNTGSDNTAIGANALFSNTTGSDNPAIGANALFNNTIGIQNTAIGADALLTNTTGFFNTAIGTGASTSSGDLFGATAIGLNVIVDDNNKIRLGNTAVTVIEGQVAFTSSSDATKKENFRPVDGEEVLKKIRGMRVTSWNFIGHDPEQFRHYGPMAQDFFAAFGHDEIGTIGTPTTITSTDMAGILMIAMQALEKRTTEVAELKGRVEALERLMRNGPYATVLGEAI